MKQALLLLLVACTGTVTSVNPNNPTEEERLTLWKVWEVPKNDWFAIGGPNLNALFIVGKGGRIIRYDGLEKFNDVPSPTTENLYAIFMPTEARGFAVGANGTIIAWDGGQWKLETSGTTLELRGVWADQNQAFAVGAEGVALVRSSGTWAPVMTDSPDDLFSIVRGGGQPFAVGTLGTISTYNGMTFTRQALTGFPKTLVAATAGPGGTFIGGVDGAVFNRGSGQRVTGLPASFVRGITAPTNGLLYVVGWDGLLARVQGGQVLSYKDANSTWMYGVWSASPADVWAVGADGVVLSGPPLVDPAP